MYDLRDQNIGLVIVIALFLIPVIIEAFRKNLFRQFNFPALVRVFNWAFVFQLICGIILYIFVFIVDRSYPFMMDRYPAGYKINHFDVILFRVQYVFSIIGLFIYLPALITLNIANWIVFKFKKT